MSEHPLTALAAHVFAWGMTVTVAVFESPADLTKVVFGGSAAQTSPSPTAFADAIDSPADQCLDLTRISDPDLRISCAILIEKALMEMQATGQSVQAPLDRAVEEFRLAAAKTCRDMWRVEGGSSPVVDSASCRLVSNSLALAADSH